MKFERVKLVGKNGIEYSKSFGDIDIEIDGEILKFRDLVSSVLQLEKDLLEKERTLLEAQRILDHRQSLLDERIRDLELFNLD